MVRGCPRFPGAVAILRALRLRRGRPPAVFCPAAVGRQFHIGRGQCSDCCPSPRLFTYPKAAQAVQAGPTHVAWRNSTFSLLMSLLLVLNLLAQLCPPSGKELSLSSQTICSCACRGSPRPAGAGCAGCQNRRGHPLLFLLVPALRPSVRHGAAGYGPVGGPIHTLS